jgi:hypothetical protein
MTAGFIFAALFDFAPGIQQAPVIFRQVFFYNRNRPRKSAFILGACK